MTGAKFSRSKNFYDYSKADGTCTRRREVYVFTVALFAAQNESFM